MTTPTWVTSAGLAGVYPALLPITPLQLKATPALTTTYKIISGSLPPGLSFRADGLITGTPEIVTQDTTNVFVVRATSNTGGIADRTFSIRISGQAIPTFTTPDGLLFPTYDSIWIEYPIEYDNPITTNPISIRVLQGTLPPGLEINEYGLIRGYPAPPITVRNLSSVTTLATATDNTNNYVTVLGTNGFEVGRNIIFTGTTIGGIVSGRNYYVKEIINATQITLTEIPNGDVFVLTSGTGFMDVSLPAISVGEPSKIQYSFTLELSSPLGSDTAQYSITVTNQRLPVDQGGPGNPANSRQPTIYNTQPPTYLIEDSPDYGYYVLPPAGFSKVVNGTLTDVPGLTYDTNQNAYIGQFISNNIFEFKILGHDFDDNDLEYTINNLPSFLSYDSTTGWIYGVPSLPLAPSIEEFDFTAFVIKKGTNGLDYNRSPSFNFSFRVARGIDGIITWDTASDLGTIYNATTSFKYVRAITGGTVEYEIVDGELPPNLTLKSNGDIEGIVSYQPTDTFLEKDTDTVFTFTVRAYDPDFPTIITSTRTFTLTVKQFYDVPTDSLYIKCTPSIPDRIILDTLLNDDVLIPPEQLFRPDDPNFGKASSVVYAHAYGIYSSNFKEYVEAVQKNHYWRNITLGELNTAVAKDENGNVIYEVVYSTIIDNLQAYDPNYGYDYRYSKSVSEEVTWQNPKFIDLNLGPWYTSSTEIHTSFIYAVEANIITNLRMYDLLTQTGVPILLQQGVPTFYTSLSPGYVRKVYPNSLENMRKRVEQNLGADYNFRILPLWMTSQQENGNTLGFTPAWVIAYTKPGFSTIVKNNIENEWPYTLNKINFKIDRFTVNKQLTYNYDTNLDPSAWTRYPSATPTPDPIDSQNFYVLFPQKTILPTKGDYY